MAKKRFWLGILAIMLVFGMTVLGCDDKTDEPVYSYTFVNNSSYDIIISCADLNPSDFTVPQGETRSATSSKSSVSFSYSHEPLVDITTGNGIITFTNK